MSKVESIENQIRELSSDELTTLREWFAEYDAEAWDLQVIQSGKTRRAC